MAKSRRTLLALTIFFMSLAVSFQFEGSGITSFWEGKEPAIWILLASGVVCLVMILREYWINRKGNIG